MNNNIVIKSVYGNVGQTYYINPCPNPRTGKYPECIRTVNSFGDMILSEEDKKEMSLGLKHFVPADKIFEIKSGKTFDLDDLVDKAEWEAIEYCSWIAKDRFEKDANGNLIIDGNAKRYGVADLFVERPGELIKVKITKKQLIHKASQYVYDDTLTGRIQKCKVLGRDLKNAAEADVLDYLIDKAEKDPKKIISFYEDESWKQQIFIIDAIDKRVIKKQNGLYTYDEKLLGASMEAVADFMKDYRNITIVSEIKKQTYPNLLPKSEIAKLEEELTAGLPEVTPTKKK